MGASIEFAKVPLLLGVHELVRDGFFTGASGRNWAGYGADVILGASVDKAAQNLLTDPQTSGGLLVACSPETVDEVLAIFRDQQFYAAAVIGEITAGASRVMVS